MVAYSKNFAVFGPHIGQWWSEPVDYAAQVQYFTKRSIAGAVQLLIGLGTGLDAVISLVILLPSASSVTSRVAVAVFTVLQFFWAWVWCCRPWPSRRMSLAFVISADIAISAVALSDASWLMGLFGFTFFSMISVFLVFFDGPKVLAGHVLWILLSTTGFAVHVGAGTQLDVVELTAKMLVAVALVAATPLGIHCAIWAMRNDANESVTDPLTGLLNRRGLQLHIGDLVRDNTTMEAEVAVMVVDLDRFKHINDTFGHPTGDKVLIRCARRIKAAVRRSALVARVGGEEFVIVALAEPGHTERETDRVRSAIAAPAAPPITASVGVTTVALGDFAVPGVDPVALLDTIVERADNAMFDAKRNGGNATVHVQPVDGDG
jgi:diguanylate cyclase (GGDEF)-like protein